jgi:hypothetical protein
MIKWLPFLHPIWQIMGITLGFMALREGLALRRGRRPDAGVNGQRAPRARHVRLGKYALGMLCTGYLLGLGELWMVRGETVLRSAHFYFATLALALFCWGAWYGFAMRRSPVICAEQRDLHGFLLPLALLILVGAGFFGLQLLP